MSHPPEPWKVVPSDSDNGLYDVDHAANGTVVSDLFRADAERIVACVNACEGVDTEALKGISPILGLDDLLASLAESRGKAREDLTAKVDRCDELCEQLVDHMLSMGASRMEAPVMRASDDGKVVEWKIIVVNLEEQ